VVSGGSGGVGSTIVQMARALGARVAATAGSAEKCELCRKLGAETAINYKSEDLAQAVKRFAPRGLNLWIETSREPDFERVVALLATRGRMVILAGRDARPIFPVGPFYTRDLAVHGFAMFNASAAEQRECAADINNWLAAGELRPVIGRVMKLSEAAAAHKLQEDNTMRMAGTLSGKIVLEP
jgi:NADPH2:quinone reductase